LKVIFLLSQPIKLKKELNDKFEFMFGFKDFKLSCGGRIIKEISQAQNESKFLYLSKNMKVLEPTLHEQ